MPVLSIAQVLHLLIGRRYVIWQAVCFRLKAGQPLDILLQAPVQHPSLQHVSRLLGEVARTPDLLQDGGAIRVMQ